MTKLLRAIHLFWWQLIGLALHQFIESTKVRYHYSRRLCVLRRNAHLRPIRVVFFVSDISKWKGQTVYDLMLQSSAYSPEIAIFPQDEEIARGKEYVSASQEEKRLYFDSMGMNVRSQWDIGRNCAIPLSADNVDIVFYQQPWFIPEVLQPDKVSRVALTFYFPYFVLNNSNNLVTGLEIGQWFHRMLFGHIVFSEDVERLYERRIGGGRLRRAGEFLPLGHPMLDNFVLRGSNIKNEGYVIYAPHFSIAFGAYDPILKYATFVWNGREILAYAKEHPEIKWVFKPHPGLKLALVKSGFMTESEVDAYYDDWARIGKVCYTASYVDLFLASRAMITDCGSFLTEYAATGMPIIHLENPNSDVRAHPILETLYATYYRATSCDEMFATFESVLLRGEDPKKDARQDQVAATGLRNVYAAKNILEYLDALVLGK